jgi:hypothetical protein
MKRRRWWWRRRLAWCCELRLLLVAGAKEEPGSNRPGDAKPRRKRRRRATTSSSLASPGPSPDQERPLLTAPRGACFFSFPLPPSYLHVVPRSASSFSSQSGPRVVNPGSYFAPVTKSSRRSQHRANSPYLVSPGPRRFLGGTKNATSTKSCHAGGWWSLQQPAASSHLSAIASSFFPPGSWLAVPVPAASSH